MPILRYRNVVKDVVHEKPKRNWCIKVLAHQHPCFTAPSGGYDDPNHRNLVVEGHPNPGTLFVALTNDIDLYDNHQPQSILAVGVRVQGRDIGRPLVAVVVVESKFNEKEK
jgi:hypothetical protein